MNFSIWRTVRILWGEQNPWFPLERGRALAELVKTEVFTVLPGAGHLPQLEQPEQVLAVLSAFLA